MIFEDKVNVNFSDMLEGIEVPLMYKAKQSFNKTCVEDVVEKTKTEMEKFLTNKDVQNKKIAITAGSRGIANIQLILKQVIDSFKSKGATPFLVAAMGSHGGATPQGQLDILKKLNITEDYMQVPIRCSMDTQKIGQLENGVDLHYSSDAFSADGVFVVNKIKPHADFKGDYESGISKMITIGLGKHKGCASIHKLGFASFPTVLPKAAEIILEKTNIIGAMGLIENSYDEIMLIESLEKKDILKREKQLLTLAKENIARIKLKNIDVLIIDEIGKHISGEGMDPNVTGRPGSYLKEGFDNIDIGIIFVRDIAHTSAGNGAGIGMADITTISCAKKIDLGAMYTNSITAGILGPARLPVILNNDKEAILTAIKTAAPNNIKNPRVVRIKNTLMLEDIEVSQSLLDELSSRDDVYIGEQICYEFNENDDLKSI